MSVKPSKGKGSTLFSFTVSPQLCPNARGTNRVNTKLAVVVRIFLSVKFYIVDAEQNLRTV